LRVILNFFDHVDWSGKKIDKNMKKIIEYFKKNNILYGEDPFDYYKILIEMTKAEFLEFASFLIEELGASLMHACTLEPEYGKQASAIKSRLGWLVVGLNFNPTHFNGWDAPAH